MYLLPAYFFGAFAVLAYVIIPSVIWRNSVVFILSLLAFISFLFFIRKTVIRKWLQRKGTLTIGQLKDCSVDQGIYFEQAGMWFNRVDALIEYTCSKGMKRQAKVRDYIYRHYATDYRSGQAVPIRYSTRFPRFIALDWSVQQKERAAAVRQAKQKRTRSQ